MIQRGLSREAISAEAKVLDKKLRDLFLVLAPSQFLCDAGLSYSTSLCIFFLVFKMRMLTMNRNGKQAFPRVLISIALQKPGKVAVWVSCFCCAYRTDLGDIFLVL